jgi:hypothetical protein
MSRDRLSVDNNDTENRKIPDGSLVCRALAQDGVTECREIAYPSTITLPKTAKHLTDRSSVGLQPRIVFPNVERSPIRRQ